MQFEQALTLMKNGCRVKRDGIIYSLVRKPTGMMFKRENMNFPSSKPSYAISFHVDDMLAGDWEVAQ